MLTAALVALPMLYIHPNYFHFIIGFFISYMLLTGKRYLNKERPNDVKPVDWSLTLLMFTFAIACIVIGGYYLNHSNCFGTVFLIFGSTSVFLLTRTT